MIEIVCASHNREILKNNLLKSDITLTHPVNILYDYTNIPKAYNSVETKGVTMYTHHDCFYYSFFEQELLSALLNAPPDWAVMGLAGVKWEDNQRKIVGYIMDRGRPWGTPLTKPFEEVDTLDELMIITRGDLKFDEQFEQDYYGADICMQAKMRGQKCYVFKSFCDHNSSRKIGGRTESFYVSKERFRQKWKDYLPIACTTGLITEELPA